MPSRINSVPPRVIDGVLAVLLGDAVVESDGFSAAQAVAVVVVQRGAMLSIRKLNVFWPDLQPSPDTETDARHNNHAKIPDF